VGSVAIAVTVVLAGSAGASAHTPEQARASVEAHVRGVIEGSGGVYRLAAGPDGRTLDLEYVNVGVVSAGDLWTIHDPHRLVDGDAFAACAIFRGVGEPEEKLYDVDMLIEARDGNLVVTEVSLHKEKQLVDGKWVWKDLPAPAGDQGRR
jgi:hypothetical protein